jgi:hypothetical protein
MLEEFGGDVPSVQVSGLTGAGLDTLVETISAVAEQQDLRAERDGHVQGYVLESRVQKGFGYVAFSACTGFPLSAPQRGRDCARPSRVSEAGHAPHQRHVNRKGARDV